MNAKEAMKNFGKKITPAYITKIAMFTAISFILYMFVKFSLPFMFPSFLEIQFSELPAILGGYCLGPVAGVLIIVFKTLLKFPFTSTAFVGEITDMVLGIAYVLPASIIYCLKKSRKNALIGLGVGVVAASGVAILLNRFVSVPFYVEYFFGGNFEIIVNICRPLYKNVTKGSFYRYYLMAAVLPFNLLRLLLVSTITFLVYKPLAKAMRWEIKLPKKKQEQREEMPQKITEEKEDPLSDAPAENENPSND